MKKIFFKNLRLIVINSLATTALSIIIMCLVAVIKGFTLWGATVPFEMLLLNLLIHIGIFALEIIDVKYRILHYAIIFLYSIGLTIGFGFLFGWFRTFQIWIICLVTTIVLALAIVIDVLKINRDVSEINKKLAEIANKRKSEEDTENTDYQI